MITYNKCIDCPHLYQIKHPFKMKGFIVVGNVCTGGKRMTATSCNKKSLMTIARVFLFVTTVPRNYYDTLIVFSDIIEPLKLIPKLNIKDSKKLAKRIGDNTV